MRIFKIEGWNWICLTIDEFFQIHFFCEIRIKTPKQKCFGVFYVRMGCKKILSCVAHLGIIFSEVIIMAKTATIRARIEPRLKEDVEKLFQKMGLTTTEALNLFYRQVKLRNGLPFNVVIPNKTTEKVFKDTDAQRNLVRCDNADDMFDNLGI